MNVLTPVAIASAEALAAVVAESLASVEPGLGVAARGFAAGEALVDLVAVDERGGLVAVVVEVEAGPAAVLRAIEAAGWCRENAALVGRLFAGADPAVPTRALVVARRVGERARRLLRTLGRGAPAACECRVFELGGQRCVSYEPAWEPAGAGGAEAEEGAGADGPPGGVEPEARERARGMIEQLEALRFRQAFQS